MRRVVILGGSGAIGSAMAQRFLRDGWCVELTGRDPDRVPPVLIEEGAVFHTVERADTDAVQGVVGDGVDLLVDFLAFRARDVETLLPVMASSGQCVVMSTRAVYADARGHHINSLEAPDFPVPVGEGHRVVEPATDGVEPMSREGYARHKRAAEITALDSGLPVTVIRSSQVHGRWARNARTRDVARLMTGRERRIRLPYATERVHLTAAQNIATLAYALASAPTGEPRILNCADPDRPTTLEIFQRVADAVKWGGEIEAVDGPSREAVTNPWAVGRGFFMDTRAAERLGYRPEGGTLDLIGDEAAHVS